jgi:hypothetical protein
VYSEVQLMHDRRSLFLALLQERLHIAYLRDVEMSTGFQRER